MLVLEIGLQFNDSRFWIQQHCAGIYDAQDSGLTGCVKCWSCPNRVSSKGNDHTTAPKTMKLKEEIHNSTWGTVLECSEVMNRQRNLVFRNIPEDRPSPSCVQRQVLVKYIFYIFHLLNIPTPYPYIKRFKRVGVPSDSRTRSFVVTDFRASAGKWL